MVGPPKKTTEERLTALETTVAMLLDHSHDSQGKTVISLYGAQEVVDDAIWELRLERRRKENQDADHDRSDPSDTPSPSK